MKEIINVRVRVSGATWSACPMTTGGNNSASRASSSFSKGSWLREEKSQWTEAERWRGRDRDF